MTLQCGAYLNSELRALEHSAYQLSRPRSIGHRDPALQAWSRRQPGAGGGGGDVVHRLATASISGPPKPATGWPSPSPLPRATDDALPRANGTRFA